MDCGGQQEVILGLNINAGHSVIDEEAMPVGKADVQTARRCTG
jgi:hypothetical protein